MWDLLGQQNTNSNNKKIWCIIHTALYFTQFIRHLQLPGRSDTGSYSEVEFEREAQQDAWLGGLQLMEMGVSVSLGSRGS